MSSDTPSRGPDLGVGIDASRLADGGMLRGVVDGEPVLLVRRGQDYFAVGASCTHYGGPLEQGIVVDNTVRCPWHHACFSLTTGEALRAPALNPLPCYEVEVRDGRIRVGAKRAASGVAPPTRATRHPASVLIVGGGAAGNAAAEMLRREGFKGRITMLSADANLPCDRPNLSKNFLAGTAQADWIPLRDESFYREQGIEVRLNTRVTALDAASRTAIAADGSRHSADVMLLATGADPIRLNLPGADLPHVRCLRTQADAEALVERVKTAKRAVVIGASFIGLEVAASLRNHGIEVHVVAPETVPMERVLGAKIGSYVKSLHEEHGVVFHLGTKPRSIDVAAVTLDNDEVLPADLVIMGVGVRPNLGLAEKAGLAVERGVLVNEYLETSAPGIYAAGDIARWPDALSGQPIRVEHWVVAERQGQVAARNILGYRERYDAVPFFWTEQYDFQLGYVGHAEGFDLAVVDGDIAERDATVVYRKAGRKEAVAVIGRDRVGLLEELGFERLIQPERAYTME